jgi:Zn-dependent protease with chaperone function
LSDQATVYHRWQFWRLLDLAERRPHRVKEFFLYTHPSINRRIDMARRMTA